MEKFIIGVALGGLAGALLTANNYKMRILVKKGQEEVQAKLDKIIDEKNPDLENKQDVAQKVGVGAVIFGALYNNKIKDIVDMLNTNRESYKPGVNACGNQLFVGKLTVSGGGGMKNTGLAVGYMGNDAGKFQRIHKLDGFFSTSL